MRHFLTLILSLVSVITACSQTPAKSEVVHLGNRDVYYEVHGEGEPLLLLHGYTQSSKYWRSYLSNYTDHFQVYVIDLLGHGKSSPFKETLSIKSAASDVYALMRYLKLDSVKGIGYSYGGDVLLHLAVLQPKLVRSIISIGACGSWNAKDYPEVVQFLSYKNYINLKWMPEYQESEAQSKAILDQFSNYVVTLTEKELKTIRAKTLFVLGDQDNSIPLNCIVEARKSLPESYLWVLPDSQHGAHEGKNEEEFVTRSIKFFKRKGDE